MIFCILGTTHFGFSRLVNFAREAALMKNQKLVIQGLAAGQSSHEEAYPSLPKVKFNRYIDEADFCICHAGAGTLRSIVYQKKRAICIPRLKKFGEHIDNHQMQIAMEFMQQNLVFMPEIFWGENLESSSIVTEFSGWSPVFSDTTKEDDLGIYIKKLVSGYLSE